MPEEKIKKYDKASFIINAIITFTYLLKLLLVIFLMISLYNVTPVEDGDAFYLAGILGFLGAMYFLVIVFFCIRLLLFVIALGFHRRKKNITYIMVIDCFFAYTSLVYILAGIESKSILTIAIGVIQILIAAVNLFVQIKRLQYVREKNDEAMRKLLNE